MDVLTAAWLAAGSPAPEPPSSGHSRPTGRCARCGTSGPDLVATREVISKTFTGFDAWHHPNGSGVCAVCCWGFRTSALRAAAHLVTLGPSLRQLSRAELAELLADPVSPGSALIVPLRPGRKHLAPAASWGVITVDDTHLTWSVADTRRFAIARGLRALGFGPRTLLEPAPPWRTLRKLHHHRHAEVIADWSALAPWRTRRPWLDLAAHALAPAGAAA